MINLPPRKSKRPWNAGTKRERMAHKRKAGVRAILRRVEDTTDRDLLASVLSKSDDPRFVQLVDRLINHRSISGKPIHLETHLKAVGISFTDFVDVYGKVRMGEGLMNLYNHVPEVLDHVGEDAKSRDQTCTICDGDGVTKGKRPRTCSTCGGKGVVRVKGDKDARSLLFESIGLTGKRGPMFAQQINIGDGSESLESLVGSVEQVFDAPALPAKADE